MSTCNASKTQNTSLNYVYVTVSLIPIPERVGSVESELGKKKESDYQEELEGEWNAVKERENANMAIISRLIIKWCQVTSKSFPYEIDINPSLRQTTTHRLTYVLLHLFVAPKSHLQH